MTERTSILLIYTGGTIGMVKDLLKAIKKGEVNLPMSFIGGDTIYVDADAYGWLGEKL